jgi:hypothetical protein
LGNLHPNLNSAFWQELDSSPIFAALWVFARMLEITALVSVAFVFASLLQGEGTKKLAELISRKR